MRTRIKKALTSGWQTTATTAVRSGLHPRWTRYTEVPPISLRDAAAPRANEVIHPTSREPHALPFNVADRAELPANRGWWGYAFRDVPERCNGATELASVPDCTIAPVRDDEGQIWVAALNGRGRYIDVREMAFRPVHRRALAGSPVRSRTGVWILERSCHNFAHWLTAHLPKLLLLRERGVSPEFIYLADERPGFVDASLRCFGFDPERFAKAEIGRALHFEEVMLFNTDRFRPELLRSLRKHCPAPPSGQMRRRLFISRRDAPRRRLVNEAELAPLLERHGIETVVMETLDFADQVRLMQEAELVVAPHGAGLANILFCQTGTRVIEIADLSFPNPNFYACAAALHLPYAIVRAEGCGEAHPLERDMRVAPERLADALEKAAALAPTPTHVA